MWQRVFLCMSRNKLKKAQSYLETCLVRVSLKSVFRKPPENICWWFLSHFDFHFRAILTLESPWEGPWNHSGTPLDPDLKKTPNFTKTTLFEVILKSIWEHFWLWKAPGRVPGTTLGRLWTQTSKKHKILPKRPFFYTSFWRPFFIKFSLFFIAILNYVLGNPPNRFLKDFGVILRRFLE